MTQRNDTPKNHITIHNPDTPDTATQETYKIFFKRPSEELPQSTIPITPSAASASISNLKFRGFAPNMARYGQGGIFSFQVEGATSIALKLDFNAALEKMQADHGCVNNSSCTCDVHKYYKDGGTGIVELDGAVVPNQENSFVWEGNDTLKHFLPVGHYGDELQNIEVEVSYQAKLGEIHFPMVDVEGMNGGITVECLNISDNDEHKYDIYFNNTPLVNGRIRANEAQTVKDGYYVLTDCTRSLKVSNSYFTTSKGVKPANITTMEWDGSAYVHRAHNSSIKDETMIIGDDATGTNGGGNNAGIDMWTYYELSHTAEQEKLKLHMAIIDAGSTGTLDGYVFYDQQNSSGVADTAFDHTGGEGLEGIKVHLLDKDGEPFVHEESLPVFDENGFFVRKVGVFAEDVTCDSYNEIDASKGVIMYSYFTVTPDVAHVEGMSLSIGNKIDINYYVDGLDEFSVNDYYMTFTDAYGRNLLDAGEYTVRLRDQSGAGEIDSRGYPVYAQRYAEGVNLTMKKPAAASGGYVETPDEEENPHVKEQILYAYSFPNINAYNMTDRITATLYYSKDGERFLLCDSAEYSIEEYAVKMLKEKQDKGAEYNPATDTKAKLYAMLVDMLNYGTTAKKYAELQKWIKQSDVYPDRHLSDTAKSIYKRENESDLENEMAEYQPEQSEPVARAAADKAFSDVQVRAVMEKGMNIALEVSFTIHPNTPIQNCSLVLYSDPSKLDQLTLNGGMQKDANGELVLVDEYGNVLHGGLMKDGGGEITIPPEVFELVEEQRYKVTIGGIASFFWDNGYELRFKSDGEVQYRLKYSVNSYCYDKVYGDNKDANLFDLLKSMFQYNKTALEWFDHGSTDEKTDQNYGNAASLGNKEHLFRNMCQYLQNHGETLEICGLERVRENLSEVKGDDYLTKRKKYLESEIERIEKEMKAVYELDRETVAAATSE